MADERRSPIGIEVNGAFLFVKDPNASTGALFAGYQRVTGLSSFTLPAEVGSDTEIQTIDGSIGFASRAGVGTITGVIAAATPGVAQQFMEAKRADGKEVMIAIVRPAVAVGQFTAGAAGALVDISVGKYQFKPAATITRKSGQGTFASAADLMKAARADYIINYKATGAHATEVADPLGASSSTNDGLWQTIVSVDSDNAALVVAPGFNADLSAADGGSVWLRKPGVILKDILGTVTGFDVGDFQQGSALAGNFTFKPASEVPRKTAYPKTDLTRDSATGAYTF